MQDCLIPLFLWDGALPGRCRASDRREVQLPKIQLLRELLRIGTKDNHGEYKIMDDSEFRFGVIFVIWVAAAAILIAGSPSSFVQGILLLFTILATIVIAIVPYLSDNEREKAKRDAGATIDENEMRLRILMELLDDEDKARIRAKLMNGFSDGELPVDEFIDEKHARS